MNVKARANGYLVTALFLGAMLPVMLSIANSMNTFEFLFLTFGVSSVASYALVNFTKKKSLLFTYLRDKKTLALLAAIGLLPYAVLDLGLSYAERFISASLATVVYRSYPLLMLLFLPILLKERITKYQIAALSLAFLGLYLAFSGGNIGFLGGSNSNIILLMVMVALASALAMPLIKRFNYEMSSCIFIFNLSNFVLFTVLFLIQGAPVSPNTLGNIVPILYVGIIYNVLVNFFYYEALRIHKTTFVTNIYFLSPFITIVYSNLILGEVIKPYYVVIAALVAVGIMIQRLDKVGGSYIPKKSRRPHDFFIFDVSGAFANTSEVAIANALKDGGRVLAVKLPEKHEARIMEMASERQYANVFTGRHKQIADEADFVKSVTGASTGDIVLMKAGDLDEGEIFFSEVSDLINPDSLEGM